MTGQSTNPERRATRRIPVSLGAVLYYNTLMLPECCVRDLSPEGAFVATSGNFLPDQALLDLAFSVPVAGGVPQRFTAQVMRCTEEGVGVRLRHNDTSSMRNLIETLYAA
ncbi:MAG: PilZ domain-containing protein [Pseudomonadota bacterium]